MKKLKTYSALILALTLLFTVSSAAYAQTPQPESLLGDAAYADLGETAYAESYESLAADLCDGKDFESIMDGSNSMAFAPSLVDVDTADLYLVQSYALAALYEDGSFEYYTDTLEVWSSFSTFIPSLHSAYAGYARVFYVTILEAGSVSNQEALLTSGTLYLDQMYSLGSTWEPSSVYVGGITLQQYAFFSADHRFQYNYRLPSGVTTYTGYVMN